MHISEKGIGLLKEFEGLRLTRYLDSVGVPTIGFGTTQGDLGHPVPASCSLAQAEGWLRDGMARNYEPAINALGVPLNQNQFDALCSFVYNLGPGSMQWDVGRYLRARNYVAAANALLEYNRAGGQVLAGLSRRRYAERSLFLTPWVDPDPNHYRLFDTKVRNLGHGHYGSERDLVKEYDRKRARWLFFRGRLSRLRDDLGILAGRLETVIHDDPAGNEANHRRFRHGGLVGRADGRRYA